MKPAQYSAKQRGSLHSGRPSKPLHVRHSSNHAFHIDALLQHPANLIDGEQLEEFEVLVARDAANARDTQGDQTVDKKGVDRYLHCIHPLWAHDLSSPESGDYVSWPFAGLHGAREQCETFESYQSLRVIKCGSNFRAIR
jgi:hypothetical protein